MSRLAQETRRDRTGSRPRRPDAVSGERGLSSMAAANGRALSAASDAAAPSGPFQSLRAPGPGAAGACACGGGECLQCRRKALGLQAKMQVGGVHDEQEREADRVAAQLLQMRTSDAAGGCADGRCAPAQANPAPRIQRRAAGAASAPSSVAKDFTRRLGPAQPLAPATRAYFEPRMGMDLGGVQVHAGAEAAQASSEIGACAFTVGNRIAFGAGQYAPQMPAGRELLAHELVHVAQQSSVIRRKPGDPPAPVQSTPAAPASADIKDVMAFYARLPPTDIKQYFVVSGNHLSIYGKDGKARDGFTLQRPGQLEIKGYYLGNPFYGVGWGWIAENAKKELEVTGLSKMGMAEQKKKTPQGELLRLLDQELYVIDWIKDADIKRFWERTEQGLIAMAVLNTPLKAAGGAGKEGPVLSRAYPDWFKELKAKVEEKIAADRSTDKANPNLPDRIFFYGSDRVQAQKGADAWTIEVEKGKREAYLTIVKKSWDDAPDKTVYAQQVAQELYKKVKLMADEAQLQKEEQKEITEIDGTGVAKKKGSKWGWAVTLKKQIETLLATQKKSAPEAKDFPDKLTLATQGEDKEARAHLRIWVYDDKKTAKPDALPELKGGTLPVALKSDDRAEDWAPITRKAADALRRGAVTTDPNAAKSDGTPTDAKGEPGVLPPYPSLIHPRDMNPDRSTATIATNEFRMVVNTAAAHGSNLLNLTTIHMGMNIGYSWKIYPLPEELKPAQAAAAQDGPAQLLEKSNEFVRTKSAQLGEPKETYDVDYDWDQSVKMSALGVGEYLLYGKASIAYPSDWNMRRQPSVAGLPFTVKTAEEIAAQSANADSDALAKLKAQLATEKDEKKKQSIQAQIDDLQTRESGDLLTLTRKDKAETQKLVKKAGELKKFITDDRQRKLKFTGTKDYDPFMFRLKAFDKDLYALYILVRQVYDFRYDDLTAIDEYSKLIQQQYDDLNKLEKRTGRLTDNPQLRTDLPEYRSVAGLVKEDDGNLVPLILVVGHHKESDPAKNKHKMLLMDVTFDAPKKGDMTYAGGERSTEEEAVKSVFTEFGEDNKYGDGKVVYRVPKKGYKGQVDSTTTFTEYLGYALAVLGIVLLVAGAILSAGTLAPGAAVAVGGIVTALGISAGVAGAVLAARNISKRREKGTFELDAEFALDVIAIIGAAVQVAGTVGKIATLSRGIGAAQKLMQVQRLEKLLVVYGAVELGGNAILVGLKVKEDVDAVKALKLPPEQEDEMMQQIAMEAVQQGAMLAFAGFSHVKDVAEHIQARVEKSRYRSFMERGWVDEHGKPTELAPPALREHANAPGKPPGKAAQGEQAWKESVVLGLAAKPTEDQQHKLTVTENGRIIRCSEFCTDLRLKYGKMLGEDPSLNSEMTALETRAKEAAAAGDKGAAEKVAAEAAVFEGKLKQADDLRTHLFGMTEAEIDAALESIDAGKVSGGEKSGHKIDDVRIPKRQRRQIDVTDIMTEAEQKALGKGGFKRALERIGRVMGKKISDIELLKKHWDAARTEVLKGKQPTDYSREEVIAMYKTAQRKFWENVRKDPAAVEFLKNHGFEFEGDSGAAMATLGPQGQAGTERGHITNQERRISLDHIDEKAQGENWKRALDADNLELMFQNANSWKEIVQVKFGMRNTAQ
jgi:hypothetical protein